MNDARPDADTIRALEQQRYCAMRDGDVDALEALCADELFYTHSNAARDTKFSLLAKFRDQVLLCKEVHHHPEDDVIVMGDTAIAAGQVTGTVYVNGTAIKLRNRALAVWSRQCGHWRLLAYQSTPIPAS